MKRTFSKMPFPIGNTLDFKKDSEFPVGNESDFFKVANSRLGTSRILKKIANSRLGTRWILKKWRIPVGERVGFKKSSEFPNGNELN